LDNAIASVPKHGYAWASSVQSKDLLPALDYELLDSRRRESEGFVQESRPNKVLSLPARNQALKKYEALVLDCEMVEFKDHISDLVRISVVDFLTGETVLNAFVQPTGHVRDWPSRFSGVTPGVLRAARADRSNTVLMGWPEA
jgi:hypothetical protein